METVQGDLSFPEAKSVLCQRNSARCHFIYLGTLEGGKYCKLARV